MVHMHNRHFAVSMTIGGEKVQAFSAISLNLPGFPFDYSQHIIDHSRSLYAQQRSAVERFIGERYGLSGSVAAAPQAKPSATPASGVTQPKTEPATNQKVTSVVKTVISSSTTKDEPTKTKRKRVRKRKKTPSPPASLEHTNNNGLLSEEHVVHLK